MRGKRFALLIGLLAIVAVATMAVAQPGAGAPAPRGEGQLQFIIELPPTPKCEPGVVCPPPMTAQELVELVTEACCFQVDSFFDISYVSNIGSSGLDGTTATFQVDSFFDVFYEIEFNNPPGGDRTVQTEILSMDLSGIFGDPDKPAAALDAVTRAVNGHVP